MEEMKMWRIATYCPNVQILVDLIGEEKMLQLTTDTCDKSSCAKCIIHPSRINFEKFTISKKEAE